MYGIQNIHCDQLKSRVEVTVKNMMKQCRLYIDAGNTRLKCLLENGVEPFTFSIEHNSDVQSAFLVMTGEIDKFLAASIDALRGVDAGNKSEPKIDGVYISSVVGSAANKAISNIAENVWNIKPKFASVDREFDGIKNSYRDLNQMGVDRWVAIHGVDGLEGVKGGSYIVVDCGTAITVDVVIEEAGFVGGAILPGINLALTSLSRADGISVSNYSGEDVELSLGITTDDCCELGVLASCIGGIKQVITVAEQRYGNIDQKIFTGGASKLLLPLLGLDYIYEPNLIFKGLKRLYQCE